MANLVVYRPNPMPTLGADRLYLQQELAKISNATQTMAAAIQDDEAAIATNTTNIATNTTNIATNTTNIATNTASIAAHESAWTAYTPTITGAGGAVGTAVGCRYKKIGKTLHIRLGVTIGTGGSLISIALPAGMTPFAAYPSGTFLTGRENLVVGTAWVGLVGYPTSGVVTPFRYDAVPNVTAGWRIDMSGAIELA